MKLYFLGIGGIGMSGLASCLHEKGYEVRGFDKSKSLITENLERLGIDIYYGDDSNYLPPEGTWVITSTAIKKEHPHLKKLIKEGYTLFHRSQLLQKVCENKVSIAVTGTHGKTSISSMLAYLLQSLDPQTSYFIGGQLIHNQSNGKLGDGKYLVFEADESDASFLNYQPQYAVISNLNWDHMDHYKTKEAQQQAFKDFASKLSKESLFWCGDCPELSKLNLKGISYGFHEDNDIAISNLHTEGWGVCFDVIYKGIHYQDITVSQLGRHQALNAAIVFTLALEMGYEEQLIKKYLNSYQGVKRRAERLLSTKALSVVDDYAHHPTEIQSTLHALKQALSPQRLVAIFQPHRYSRFLSHSDDFSRAFKEADLLIVMPVFAAGEPVPEGFCMNTFIQKVSKYGPVVFLDEKQLLEKLPSLVQVHDVLAFLGAGSITHYAKKAAAQFHTHPPTPLKVGVVCGGRSIEHPISLTSGQFIFENLDPDLYDPYFVGITKKGCFTFGKDIKASNGWLIEQEGKSLTQILPQLLDLDLFFPIIHGQNGEDGSLQGFFETLGKAYVGCDVASASLCMDKAKLKHHLLSKGITTAKWLDITRDKWLQKPEKVLQGICKHLNFPVFVKGCHLGSSLGVFCCKSFDTLEETLDRVFELDYKVLVEEKVEGREIEFAVIGNEQAMSPPPGEVHTHGQVYSYEKKYGEEGFAISSKAAIDEREWKKIRGKALEIYELAGCRGFARVDGFYTQEKNFILNEINPLPGFTSISLFPKIWKEAGLEACELLQQIVMLGLKRKRDESDFLIHSLAYHNPTSVGEKMC